MKDILTDPKAWGAIANGYDETARAMLTPFSELALDWLDLQPTDRLLDVACGPGTTTLLALDRVGAIEALDFAEEMVAALRHHVAGRDDVGAVVGDGQHLPYPDGQFTVACSMFGLMFFPDPVAGLREMVRVLRPGGRGLISSWVPMADSPMMQPLGAAMQKALPRKPGDPPPSPLPFDSEAALAEGLREAGFADVQVRAVSPQIPIGGAAGYWSSFRDTVFVHHLRTTMGDAWTPIEAEIVTHLDTTLAGVEALAMPALLGRGTKAS